MREPNRCIFAHHTFLGLGFVNKNAGSALTDQVARQSFVSQAATDLYAAP